MSSAFDTSSYNIEGTLFAWVVESVAAYPPPLAPTAGVVLDRPEDPLAAPVYAVYFMGTLQEFEYQGRTVDSALHGASTLGLMRIETRVSRRVADWRGQMNQMMDALKKAYNRQASGALVVKDFYTNAAAPADTGYRITLVDQDRVPFGAALNPDIEGDALQILYRYIERA